MKLFSVSLDNPKIRKAVDEFQDIPFDGTFNVIAVNGILGHNKLTKYEYEVFKNKNLLFVNKQPIKIMHDDLYYIPVELREKYKKYLNTNLCYKLISNIIIFNTFYLKNTKNNLVIVCENYDEKLFELFDKYNDLYNVEVMKPECLKSKEKMINWNYGDLIETNYQGYINIMTNKNKTKFIDINENELFLEFKE